MTFFLSDTKKTMENSTLQNDNEENKLGIPLSKSQNTSRLARRFFNV